ncbi:MAG: putative Glycine--tRNA ligase [Streblomastix strix]|uniref:Putative Glycine--tRNA ligase n=1 Tax=Streblomastix strix TaxID=222440 RepID=A0A5J4WUT4_9EUKA|nr:MAG: putative Glycine--tRNA ligase [Streblomastix strix]
MKQARSGIVPQITSSTSEPRILLKNEILAFYIGRTQLFLEKIVFRRSNLRFRQHLDKQRAHYARDCWDAEALTTSGWVEIIGIADRDCFDLGAHAKGSGKQIGASRKLDQPIEKLVLKPEKGKISQIFKKDTSIVANYIESLNQNEEEASSIKAQLNEGKDGVKEANIYPYKTSTGERDLVKSVKITPEMISLKTEKLTEENFYPFVIEPSFGISRILFSSIEYGIYTRPEDDQRAVIPFPPSIAPIKIGIFPLYSKKPFIDLSLQIAGLLQHFPTRIDKSSASIGRRYSRSDEICIPFCTTVDYASLDSDVEIKKEKSDEESGKESLRNQTVTIRERDSMDQIRVHRSVVVDIITRLVKQELLWNDAVKQFPGADKKDQKE